MPRKAKKPKEEQTITVSIPDEHRERVLQQVAYNLTKHLRDKGLSQSELARRIWGENPNGGARGRDQVNMWCRGRKLISQQKAREVAKILNVPFEEIYPINIPVLNNFEDSKAVIKMTDAGDGKFHVSINKVMPAALAAKVIALVSAEAEN